MSSKTPYGLIILDGWGHRETQDGNAILLAETPNWDRLQQNYPHCLISASGSAVGLPEGQMGNSEVGHMNLGAGRINDQDFTRISKEIDDQSFFINPVLVDTCKVLVENGKALHLLGLLSPGGVHSHEDHIKAMISLAFKQGVKTVYLHAFLDGRDVPPRSARNSLDSLQAHIQTYTQSEHIQSEHTQLERKSGIASVIGRYYAMDRDNRWDRVESAYKLINKGESEYHYDCPLAALDAAYQRDESDEFVQASAIRIDGNIIEMGTGDAVVFMNFRADRARQITQSFISDNFEAFPRPHRTMLSRFVSLTKYASEFDCLVAYTKGSLQNSLGEIISKLNMKQLRIAETEKYAHVTFFFSGGREREFRGETRILVPSPDVSTYDLQPEMSAIELTDKLVAAIESQEYDLIICNFANGDMVGHTGDLPAAIKAVTCLDKCLGRLTQALASVDGHCLITADHGNVEQMNNTETGQSHTAHTSEQVPLIYFHPLHEKSPHGEPDSGKLSQSRKLKPLGGALCDVAPTLLDIMSLVKPEEMTGHSLLLDITDQNSATQGCVTQKSVREQNL